MTQTPRPEPPHIPEPSDICSVCGRGLIHVIPSLDAARTTAPVPVELREALTLARLPVEDSDQGLEARLIRALRAALAQARPSPDQGPARDTGGLRAALDAVERKMYDGFHPNVHPIIHRYAQEVRAALSQGAAHEERGLDVTGIETQAAAYRGALQRGAVDGKVSLDAARAAVTGLASFATRLATPEAAPEERTCARYFGSDGTLCATHSGRFAGDAARCDRAVAPKEPADD